MTLEDQIRAFAEARGGRLRYGRQPQRPAPEIPPSIGRPKPVQSPPKADPWLDYTDDYTVWKQGQ